MNVTTTQISDEIANENGQLTLMFLVNLITAITEDDNEISTDVLTICSAAIYYIEDLELGHVPNAEILLPENRNPK